MKRYETIASFLLMIIGMGLLVSTFPALYNPRIDPGPAANRMLLMLACVCAAIWLENGGKRRYKALQRRYGSYAETIGWILQAKASSTKVMRWLARQTGHEARGQVEEIEQLIADLFDDMIRALHIACDPGADLRWLQILRGMFIDHLREHQARLEGYAAESGREFINPYVQLRIRWQRYWTGRSAAYALLDLRILLRLLEAPGWPDDPTPRRAASPNVVSLTAWRNRMSQQSEERRDPTLRTQQPLLA